MWFSRCLMLLAASLTISPLAYSASYTNPLKDPNGSDPFVVYTDGFYYMTTTTWTDIQIARATTLEGLKNGDVKTVWSDNDPSRCCNMWAPEFHYFDGAWFLYYTAGNSDNLDGQRSHVARGGATPWDTYTYAGQVTGEWGIDASILRFPDQNYFIWSCMTDVGQSLCIATLDSPTSIGQVHILSEPTEDWERSEVPVQEGAIAMYHGGKTYVVYSGSYCWTPEYQLGYLTWNGSGDPLDRDSWSKTGPAFSSANGNYGTGHNGFFLSPDETEIWNIYHATANPEGACDGSRYTMAQVVNWNSDGTPNFGEAPPLSDALEGPSGE